MPRSEGVPSDSPYLCMSTCSRRVAYVSPSVAEHEHIAPQIRVELASDRDAVAHVPGVRVEDDDGRPRPGVLLSTHAARRRPFSTSHPQTHINDLSRPHVLCPLLHLFRPFQLPIRHTHRVDLYRRHECFPSWNYISLDLQSVGGSKGHIFVRQHKVRRGRHV